MIKKTLAILIVLFPLMTQSICTFYLLKNKNGHTVLLLGDPYQEKLSEFVKKNIECLINKNWDQLAKRINCFIEANPDDAKNLSRYSIDKKYTGFSLLTNFSRDAKNKILNLCYADPRGNISDQYHSALQICNSIITSVFDFSVAELAENFIPLNVGTYLDYINSITTKIRQFQKNLNLEKINSSMLSKVLLNVNNAIEAMNNYFSGIDRNIKFVTVLLNQLKSENNLELRKIKYLKLKNDIEMIDSYYLALAFVFQLHNDQPNGKSICYMFDQFAEKISNLLCNSGYDLIKFKTIKSRIDDLSYNFAVDKLFTNELDEIISSFILSKDKPQENKNLFVDAGAGAGALNAEVGNTAQTPSIVTDVYRECDSCQKKETSQIKHKQCGRCKKAIYCSVDCQKKHWASHKVLCKVAG